MGKKYQKNKKTASNSGKGMRMSNRLLILALIFALAAGGYVAKQLVFTSLDPYRAKVQKLSVSDTGNEPGRLIRAEEISDLYSLDYGVDSPESAQKVIEEVGRDLGLDLDTYTFHCTSVAYNYLMDTYTITQRYKGLPVLGYGLTMAVEPDGSVRSIIGSQAVLGKETDDLIKNVMKEDQAADIFQALADKEYQAEKKGYESLSQGLHILCRKGEKTRLVYVFRLDREDRLESVRVLVDGQTGETETFGEKISTAMSRETLEGETGAKTMAVDRSSKDKILVQDTNRNIGIYHFKSDKDASLVPGQNSQLISIQGKNGEETGENEKSAVDALYNLQRAWQYFARTQDRKGFDGKKSEIRVYVGLPEGSLDDNAALVSNQARSSYILVGTNRDNPVRLSSSLDGMGHEYTHGMIQEAWKPEAGLTYPMENEVIAEGMADIFGELIEDSYDGAGSDSRYDNSCDWISFKGTDFARNAGERTGNSLGDWSELTSMKDAHDGAWLVSHPAWLMSRGMDGDTGKQINTLRIGQLYYDGIWSLNGFSNLEDLRFVLENSAVSLCRNGRINRTQLSGVLEALDQTGIPAGREYCLTGDGLLRIYGRGNQALKKGLFKVTDLNSPEKKETGIKVSEGTCRLNLEPGLYLGRIQDQDGKTVRKVTMMVADSKAGTKGAYSNEASIYTGAETGKSMIVSGVKRIALYLSGIFLVLHILGFFFKKLSDRKDQKRGPVCQACGTVNPKGARACRQCGKLLPAPVEGHESKFSRSKEKDRGWVPRLILTILILGLTLGFVWAGSGSASDAYLEYAHNHLQAGHYIYQEEVKGDSFQKKVFSKMIQGYEKRMEKTAGLDPDQVQEFKNSLPR